MTALAVAPPAPAARVRGALPALAAAVVVAGVVTVVLFALGGGSWFVVETPSMGTAAPVGTLLVDEPARLADLHVGDVITFRPPTAPAEVYTHRIVQRVGDGVRTRGDINGADDGWIVHQRDLVGHVVQMMPVVGWVVRGLPIVIAGSLLAVLVSRGLSGLRRTVARLLGASLSVALAAAWLHPFAGAVLLQTDMVGRTVVATVVGTGILPIRASATGAAAIHLDPGQVGRLTITGVHPGLRVEVATALDLAWWGWALLAAACLLPLIASVGLLVTGPSPRGRGR